MNPERIGIEDVKPQLQHRIDDLIIALVPGVKLQGASVRVINPQGGGDQPTLAIYRRGNAVGGWKCFKSDDKGDVLDLIAHFLTLDRAGALKWAKDWLGIETMTREEKRAVKEDADKRRADQEKQAEKAELDKIAAVRRLWLKGDPLGSDTPAERHVKLYLEGRCCPFDQVPFLEADTFRTLPAQEYWPLAIWKTVDGKKVKEKPGPDFPVLMSGFKSPTGQIMAVHLTFLHPLKRRKASLPEGKNSKLMFGPVTGCVLRIATGPDQHANPQEPHPLILCEGVEDGLTIAQLWPDSRVWVGGSLHHLGTVEVNYPFISNVIVAADNDTAGGMAEQQFDVAFAALERQGKRVSVTRPVPPHKDFNDWLREDEDDDETTD